MKCKPYSEITVEIRTQLKTVKITSNIFAVWLGNMYSFCIMTSLVELFTFGHEYSTWGAPQVCFFQFFTNSGIELKIKKF